MNENSPISNYSTTLYLPRTAFPMRADLPHRELELIRRWEDMDLYAQLRKDAQCRPRYILHDGPPYANGNIHIGHALNKILKDVIVRSFQMRGYNAIYVPGWDCHGLPIEWKVEEKYRGSNLDKNEVAINEFRRECRAFASHWIDVQTQEFKRLGVTADFKKPYTTMDFHAEARIAGELMRFAMSGQLYRGSKPVMWSVVERTVLAEAEIEYHDYESDTIWVKFPVRKAPSVDLANAFVVIWTTTPWTIPGNRAVSFSSRIIYGLYDVVANTNDEGLAPRAAEKLILAACCAENCARQAKLTLRRIRYLRAEELAVMELSHPLKGVSGGYLFSVPVLDSDHVTETAGTGFVHTAPSHGLEDFDVWASSTKKLHALGIDTRIPSPIDDAGFFTDDAPGFGPGRREGPARVIDDQGNNGDANKAVMTALIAMDRLFAHGRLIHAYPHSWRSKRPIIIRNTPQWFIYMDKDLGDTTTLRTRAIRAIDDMSFVPAAGRIRLRSMLEGRPDWVLSRQRTWGVPITVFFNKEGEILRDEAVNRRIIAAFEKEGADSWFASHARARFLGERVGETWEMVRDILDVWFDSGSTHTFTLEDRADLKWPADIYLEGSDQHRGWFHHSLLESCGTYGQAPCKTVITHGFTLDERGRKMSKSLGNVVRPQDIIETVGADILRLWVMTIDYREDQRLGRNVIQTNVDVYRKLRNIIRWMIGTLVHDQGKTVAYAYMPELEKFMLHRLHELDQIVRAKYDAFDFQRIMRTLLDFSILDLSAFYFDIRKDVLYCDAPSSKRRLAALQTVREIFERLVTWLAPMLPFTMEEAWLEHHPDACSVHLEQFRGVPQIWKNDVLAERWRKIRLVRRVVTGALELERTDKRLGSSLEASPIVFITDPELLKAIKGIDMAEICITSGMTVTDAAPMVDAFRIDGISGIAVKPEKAEGRKCARSWRYTQDVGMDSDFPDVSMRDAAALRELCSLGIIRKLQEA
ncbi:MAG: isoleucyl-tRNA synthetase [Candidatus Tokpelaia sp. JSC085]|nr:MAG: isoleucyl-tRNA synthetase [Candidatus Tokpelaia sp. JSC085]